MSVDTRHDSHSTQPQQYARSMRLDLQGMRAFAVLAVFVDHLFGWPRGGFVGVDVFFVLSGFFITGLLIGERTRTGEISFANFYIRRVRRIIPSALLVIGLTVVASYFLLTATRAKGALIDGLWAAIFMSNWRFERVGTDYFAQSLPDSPLLHYWSLSIEEQFYFVWPLVLLGLFALTRRYSKPGNRYPAGRQVWLAGFMSAISLLSFAWACLQFGTNPAGAYFSTFTRLWELGVGALVAISVPLLSRIPNKIRPLLSYIGMAGAITSLFVISPTMPFPGPWAALPVLSTALVIAAFVGGDVRAVPHLTNPIAQYFGEVSYTLYLWHWPVIILLTAVLPPGPLYYVVAILLSIALTAVTYRYYENPIRRSNWLEDDDSRLVTAPKTWAVVGVIALAVSLSSAIGLEVGDRRSADAVDNQTLEVAAVAPKLGDAQRCLGAAALTTAGCVLYDPAKPVYPSIDEFSHDGKGAYDCYRKQSEPFESCTYGYKGPDAKRIAVVGNSHAAMLLPTLSQYLIENKWSMTTFVGYGCLWLLGYGECGDMMNKTQEKLLAEKFDVVIVSASRQHGDPRQVAAYASTWRPVAEAGSKILVVGDVPGVSPETLDCVTRVGSNIGDCATPRDIALSDVDPLLAAAQLVPGTKVLDMTDSFCIGDKCPDVIGNVLVYMDTGSHITATYARTLAPQVVAAVKSVLG